MAVVGRLLACLVLLLIGASMVVHSPDNPHPGLLGCIGAVLLVVSGIGMIEIALGEK